LKTGGEVFALLTALCWTVTALSFESATKKVGTLVVNIIRLAFALVFLSLINTVILHEAFPFSAGRHQWIWLSLSGLVGFVIGDYFLFKSYLFISSRISMLIMTLVPPVTMIFGFLFLNEKMLFKDITGMLLVVGGISITILNRQGNNNQIKLKHPLKGLFYAFLGALGQAFGLILSKYGMQNYDAFASTQIRTITGLAGFALIVTLMGKWKNVIQAFSNKAAMKGIATGSVFGPFLGVSFSLMAVQRTNTGVASTLMALVPVLIIIPLVLFYKQKIRLIEIAGAVVSVLGAALLFF